MAIFSRRPGAPTLRELAQQALASTERGYDLLAPKFDATPFRTPDEVLERSLADLEPVDDALDLCCGTGGAMLALRPRVQKRLVGVDFSQGMLDVAAKELEARPGPAKIELERRDVFSITTKAEFDLVTCFGAFGHVLPEAEPRFVEIVAQALRPGGRFVFVTTEQPRALSRAWLLGRAFNGVMRVRNAAISPPFIMYYLTFQLPDCAKLLRWYGFEPRIDRGFFSSPYGALVRVVATRH